MIRTRPTIPTWPNSSPEAAGDDDGADRGCEGCPHRRAVPPETGQAFAVAHKLSWLAYCPVEGFQPSPGSRRLPSGPLTCGIPRTPSMKLTLPRGPMTTVSRPIAFSSVAKSCAKLVSAKQLIPVLQAARRIVPPSQPALTNALASWGAVAGWLPKPTAIAPEFFSSITPCPINVASFVLLRVPSSSETTSCPVRSAIADAARFTRQPFDSFTIAGPDGGGV